MAKKETLAEKKATGDAIAQETIRFLDILMHLQGRLPNDLRAEVEDAMSETCEGCPVLRFHPEILQKVRSRH